MDDKACRLRFKSKNIPTVEVYGEPQAPPCRMCGEEATCGINTMANLGYIVVSTDNRGANVPRGREWRKCIYGEVGTFASEDQARGVQDLARQYSFIDSTRVGITDGAEAAARL